MDKTKIKVIMAAAEMEPLAKVGGLGDVVGSLPKALLKLGAEVKVFLPFYGSIDARKFRIKSLKKNIKLEIDGRQDNFDLYQTKLPGGVTVFLVKHQNFATKDIYVGSRKYFKKGKSASSRKDDDVERFVFFSKAVVEAIKNLKLKADVIHCHDWHTALIPTFIDEYSLKDRNFKNISSLYTIHNLASQGITSLDITDYAALNYNLTPALMEDYYDRDGGKIDSMKVGILSADHINTVSPNYAKEILSKEYGANLESYLLRRKKNLSGILNGIDVNFFNPQKDKAIKSKYGVSDFSLGKAKNKEDLQKISKLDKTDAPLFGLVTRLVKQKGLDILLPALEVLLKKYDFQLVVLGTGQKDLETGFQALAKKYPTKVKANITFDAALAQKIYAASDFFLMPSKFEPCGLGQMIAMRYGTVPVVRSTGGLKDTVINNKTGIVFKKYTQVEMKKALEASLRLYRNKGKLKKMIQLIMKQDFSWDVSAREYLKLYKKLK
ncbi:glycogen synthase [Candidatus Parcubacteria bacterium]|nr:MAG: glycogen synthase [Candidatus Parcubacteria bacterium]